MYIIQDSEDGTNLQLTPEQQKQLDMIENMPAIREVELTPEEWAAKTPEEREKIIGIVSKTSIVIIVLTVCGKI